MSGDIIKAYITVPDSEDLVTLIGTVSEVALGVMTTKGAIIDYVVPPERTHDLYNALPFAGRQMEEVEELENN